MMQVPQLCFSGLSQLLLPFLHFRLCFYISLLFFTHTRKNVAVIETALDQQASLERLKPSVD